jgi:tetratricopeptide (TPR) repeat protein
MNPIRNIAPILAGLLWLGAAAEISAWAQPPPTDEALRTRARTGLSLLMDGDLEGAIVVFREIQKADPQSPLGEMLEANALWWRILYSTGNLVDPDVFITPQTRTPHDAEFESLVIAAIAKSEAGIKNRQDLARSHLYQGMAYGLRGRLAALRNKGLPTARAAKRMRSLLLEAVRLDPNLADAYAGLGNYNYFVDTLSTIVKLLRFFIGLPGGNRVEGLKQLQMCAEKGELARAEAKFYLAKNLSRNNERQYRRSIELFQELERDYPRNPLWPMMVASLHCRMGHTEPCEAGYRSVLKRTSHPKNEVEEALHRAARSALVRRHPGEKTELSGDLAIQ